LCGKLRQIAAIMFQQIAQTGAKKERYNRLMHNVCFGFLFACEAYLKGGNEEAGLRAFWHFEKIGKELGFYSPQIGLSMSYIKRSYPLLTERIDSYYAAMSSPSQ
jgi:hypothetical protein